MTRFEARVPCRIDLAGGTLDIWPLGLLHPGACTVNLAVDVLVTVRMARSADGTFRVHQGSSTVEVDTRAGLMERRDSELVGVVAEALDLGPVEVDIDSASPRGGGLGASSALTVALIALAEALEGRPASSVEQRAHLARDLEARLMSLPTGTQDHYPALLGGAVEITHGAGGERARQLEVDLEALGRHLLLFFTGISHFSAGANWQVIRRRLEGEPEAKGLFEGIARAAAELPEALVSGDWKRVGEVVGREWSLRRHLASGVSTPEIDSLLETVASLGGWGGKACGAGGGGCVVVVCPPERRQTLRDRLAETGVTPLEAAPTGAGLRVEAVEGPRG